MPEHNPTHIITSTRIYSVIPYVLCVKDFDVSSNKER
jgi:hypothetical protein